MDAPPPSVVRYCQLGLSSEDYEAAGRDVIALLAAGSLSLQQLVVHLGDSLISTNDSVRFRGTQLLSEVLSNAPTPRFTAAELHHLAAFLSGRLSDFPTLRCSLQAAVALATRFTGGSEGAPVLQASDALLLAKSYAENLHLPSLSQPDRHLGLTLLAALASAYVPLLSLIRCLLP